MRILNIVVKIMLPKPMYDRLWRWKNWRKYSSRFDNAIQHFVIDKGIEDTKEIAFYRKKLINAFIKDEWNPDEYFFFNYERLSQKGIYEFVANREAARFWNSLNSKDIYLLTCDKGLTYKHFSEYFKRDLISVSKNGTNILQDFREFSVFVEKHQRFIVKPTFGNYGNGVRIVDKSSFSDVKQMLDDLLDGYPESFTAEELIVQCDELASFHPSSVNTVRLTTVRMSNGDIYTIHRPFIRFGQGGRCVDNGGNGGIIAAIDFETGIIKGAIDERMNHYVVHPDTGKILLGYKIPQWEEAKAFVVQLAKVMPDLNYCGWDIALTDQGWVMVEANGKGLFIGFQMPTQEGFREEFENIKQLCGYKG